MTKAITPSTKPVTREQAGKFCDKLSHRFTKSGIKSVSFQKLLKDKVQTDKLADDIVALVRKHVDMIGDTVRVDRTAPLVYPDWSIRPVDPKLEANGPAEYDLVDVQSWLLEKQKTGVVTGNDIYDHLKSNSMLESCLGLRDLQAIQKLGIEVFRKHFADKRSSGGNQSFCAAAVCSASRTLSRTTARWTCTGNGSTMTGTRAIRRSVSQVELCTGISALALDPFALGSARNAEPNSFRYSRC